MDDTARALGAGNPAYKVMIAGKECYPMPVSSVLLTELERVCVEKYKRAYLKTFTDNQDLLPPSLKDSLIEKKFEEAARMDSKSLPPRTAHDIKKIKMSDALRLWAVKQIDDETYKEAEIQGFDRLDKLLRIQIVHGLDAGGLSEEEYEKMTGVPSIRQMIPYVAWWISADLEGQMHLIWASFKSFGVTLDQIKEELTKRPSLMMEIGHEIERLSVPAVGNG